MTGQERFLNFPIQRGLDADVCLFLETGFVPNTILSSNGFLNHGRPAEACRTIFGTCFSRPLKWRSWQAFRRAFLSEMAQTLRTRSVYGICTYPGEWGFSVWRTGRAVHNHYGPKAANFARHNGGAAACMCGNLLITAQVMQGALRRCFALARHGWLKAPGHAARILRDDPTRA